MQGGQKNQLDKYVKLDKLGEGTYGLVYKARNSETGEVSGLFLNWWNRSWLWRKLSLRRRTMESLVPQSERSRSSRASSTLMLLSKYYIQLTHSCRLKEVIYQDDNLYLIFEYCEFDLKKYMRSIGGPLPLDTVKKFTYQILQATAYCHAHRVMHRDLKP